MLTVPSKSKTHAQHGGFYPTMAGPHLRSAKSLRLAMAVDKNKCRNGTNSQFADMNSLYSCTIQLDNDVASIWPTNHYTTTLQQHDKIQSTTNMAIHSLK
jgi:hypothetical protein